LARVGRAGRDRAAPEALEDRVAPADTNRVTLDPGSLGLEVRDRAGLAALVGLADTNRADRGLRARDREARDLGQNRARLHRMAVEPGRVGPEPMPAHRHRILAHLAVPTLPQELTHLAGPPPLEEATRPEEATHLEEATSPWKLIAKASKHLLVPPLPAAYDA
jgi:hypothetical protein